MNFIAGEWCEGAAGRSYELRNPFDTSDVVGEFPASDERDVDGGDSCRRRGVRSLVTHARHNGGARCCSAPPRDRGRPRRGDRPRHDSRDGQAAARSRGPRHRKGPTPSVSTPARAGGLRARSSATARPATRSRCSGGRSAWSASSARGTFPFSIPLWKAAPALAYGNCVVLKVAHEAPAAGLHLAACLEEAGVPAGVFNLVVGHGADVGTPLVRHPDVRALSFTGSVPVGERIRDEAVPLREARPARARGPQPAGGDGRRRSGSRGRGRLRGGVLVGGAEMHGDATDLRAGRGLRRLQDAAHRARGARRGRRSRRPGHRGRPADQPSASWTRFSLPSSRARQRAVRACSAGSGSATTAT